jgi:tetratricopeptide (TPR) repeat protein
VREAARASVLSYDKDARPNLAEVYGNLVGHPVAADVPAAKIAVDLFALQDKQRLADLYAIVDLGLKEQASGDNAHAVEQFDRALAREPSLDRKKEMVPAFVARGDSLAETDPTAARRAYEEALALDPDTPRKGQIMGALALLDAEALEKRGIDDRASWERVLESDPGNAKANAAIERLNAAHADRSSRANEYEYGAAGALALICLLVLFGLRGKRA